MNARPPYLADDFRGGCKIFPAPTADGREPLLLSYQTKWVNDRSRRKLAEKSRQIGWSWSEAYKIVSTKSLNTARLDHWVSSRDEIQARLFLDDCVAFAALLQLGADDLGEHVVDSAKGITSLQLRFANGLRCHSMSSNPDAQAGKRGGRTLDEFALNPLNRKLLAVAGPGITWGGDLSVFSTHRGSANYHNVLLVQAREKGNPMRWSVHRVTLQDALEAGLLYKLQKKLTQGVAWDDLDDDTKRLVLMDEAEYFDDVRAGAPDEESFNEEYMCVPSDDASAFLSYDLIDGCLLRGADDLTIAPQAFQFVPGGARVLAPGGPVRAQPGAALYLGVDVGRKVDLTVFWLNERIAGVTITRAIVEMKGAEFSKQEALLDELMRQFPVRRCCIDATGLGMQFAERAQQRHGTYRVEAVKFTGPVKEELAYPVRSAFEDRSLRIPNDKHVIADLRKVRKETTASGNIRFVADNDDGHADRFWSLALALHAGKTAGGPAYITPVLRLREFDHEYSPRRHELRRRHAGVF